MPLSLTALSTPPAEVLPLETGDERFQAMANQVMNGEYRDAAAGAAALLEHGHYDVRPIAYLSFGCFLEEGLLGLAAGLEAMVRLRTEHWTVLGPENRKDRHAATSLTWLAENIVRRLDRLDEHPALLQLCLDQLDDEVRQRVEDAGAALMANLEEVQAYKKTIPVLASLRSRVRSLQPPVEPPPVEPTPEEPAPEVTAPVPAAVPAAAPPSPAGVLCEGGPQMALLLRRLAAFEQTLEARDYTKAAIIAEDVNRAIADFDPRKYFPKVFTTYYQLMGQHIRPLSKETAEANATAWEVRQQLYQIDLDAFLES